MQGRTAYPTVDRNPRSIFQNIKKQNRAGKIVKNTFLLKENLFEFGPLLISENPFEMDNSEVPNPESEISLGNQTRRLKTFQFKNPSSFEVNISFAFLEEEEEGQEAFHFEPEELLIPPGEVGSLNVHARPLEEREYSNSLVCCISENPQTLILPSRCCGQFPRVEIEPKELNFGKLLVGKCMQRELILKNVTLLPVKWKIKKPSEGFSLEFESGVLEAEQAQALRIRFEATEQRAVEFELELEVEDVEGRGLRNPEPERVKLTAEGFFIKTSLSGFDGEDNLFDYGNVRVAQKTDKMFTLTNLGIYPIHYEALIMKKMYAEVFEVSPAKGTLEPEEQVEVTLAFCSKREITLKSGNTGQREIVLRVVDSISEEKYEEQRITVRVNSQFSQFQTYPLKSLNFRAVSFGQTRTGYFQIVNTGLFDFYYVVCDWGEREKGAALLKRKIEQDKVEETVKHKTKKTSEEENKLDTKCLRISPAHGQISREGSAEIKVEFFSESRYQMEQKLCVLIDNPNARRFPEGGEYFILGEACVPGIETQNFKSIFEEQMVVPSLNSTGMNIQDVVNANVFSTEDRTFYFGQLIPETCPEGKRERFKLSNNGKVPAKVVCSVRARPGAPELFGFSISPEKLTINPNEYAYVMVGFKPEIMAKYSGVFEALVENGDPNCKSQSLRFDLRGEGCLPTIALVDESTDSSRAGAIINFGKVRLNKKQVKKLVVRNPGNIPATASIRGHPPKIFRILETLEYSLMPKEVKAFRVQFEPTEPGVFEHTFSIETISNPYEKYMVHLKGEGYFDIVAFENLPEGSDELDFEDIVLSRSELEREPEKLAWPLIRLKNPEPRSIYDMTLPPERPSKLNEKIVRVKNFSNHVIRYEWRTPSDVLQVKPSRGHVEGQHFAEFKIRVLNQSLPEESDLDLPLEMAFQEIIPVNGESVSEVFLRWDDSKKLKFMMDRDQLKQKLLNWELEHNRPTNEEGVQIEGENEHGMFEVFDMLPEPGYEVIQPDLQSGKSGKPGAQSKYGKNKGAKQPEMRTISLRVKARIGVPKISSSVEEVLFSSTMMFSERLFSFKVFNESRVRLPVRIKIMNLMESQDINSAEDPGYFTVSPADKTLEPESESDFIIKFQPLECEDNTERILLVCLPQSNILLTAKC